ncbi:hypothetical protein ONS96_001218 [Cadophora gregata f. sp. sojae]|nr:hypothetical protein ONS96_001218 [Cadophora gregata f. sp. sojae]
MLQFSSSRVAQESYDRQQSSNTTLRMGIPVCNITEGAHHCISLLRSFCPSDESLPLLELALRWHAWHMKLRLVSSSQLEDLNQGHKLHSFLPLANSSRLPSLPPLPSSPNIKLLDNPHLG